MIFRCYWMQWVHLPLSFSPTKSRQARFSKEQALLPGTNKENIGDNSQNSVCLMQRQGFIFKGYWAQGARVWSSSLHVEIEVGWSQLKCLSWWWFFTHHVLYWLALSSSLGRDLSIIMREVHFRWPQMLSGPSSTGSQGFFVGFLRQKLHVWSLAKTQWQNKLNVAFQLLLHVLTLGLLLIILISYPR